jgi:hypothetical protein
MKGRGMLIAVALLLFIGSAFAEVQSFNTSKGCVQIDLPYKVKNNGDPGLILNLVRPGASKPILSIILYGSKFYKNLEDFAVSTEGQRPTISRMKTLKGDDMVFSIEDTGTDVKGLETYTYRGFINCTKERGAYVLIHAHKDVKSGLKVIASYNESSFKDICRSFSFV